MLCIWCKCIRYCEYYTTDVLHLTTGVLHMTNGFDSASTARWYDGNGCSAADTKIPRPGSYCAYNANVYLILCLSCQRIFDIMRMNRVSKASALHAGVLVQRLGGLITVVDLVEGGPAHLSGELKIGQVVLEVDGQGVCAYVHLCQ